MGVSPCVLNSTGKANYKRRIERENKKLNEERAESNKKKNEYFKKCEDEKKKKTGLMNVLEEKQK
jgi:hypothetical protein